MGPNIRIRTKMSNQLVSTIYHQGVMVPFLLRGGKIVHSQKTISLPQTLIRMVSDIEGNWMEFGFLSTVELEGNPSDGWVDPGQYAAIRMQTSMDMFNWSEGGWIPAPSGGVIDNLDGTFWYWSRSIVPQHWKSLLIDNRIGSDRYNKSISNIKISNTTVGLPSYPYSLPSQAAALQADLRAAGYAGALVTSSAADMTVSIINHHWTDSFYNRHDLVPTVNSSAQVTDVRGHGIDGASIPLPSYPYQMPAAQATLQADLRAAGYTGSVVKLHEDPWEIFIPDRLVNNLISRYIQLTITPGDPHPWWDAFGVYQGLNQDDTIYGDSENYRSAEGDGQVEATKQFARLAMVPGTRYATPTP